MELGLAKLQRLRRSLCERFRQSTIDCAEDRIQRVSASMDADSYHRHPAHTLALEEAAGKAARPAGLRRAGPRRAVIKEPSLLRCFVLKGKTGAADTPLLAAGLTALRVPRVWPPPCRGSRLAHPHSCASILCVREGTPE